jgi:hypothetical protein
MWLTLTLIYCGGCWLIGFLITRTRWWAAATAGADRRVRLALLEWGIVLGAPLLVPLGVVVLSVWLITGLREQRLLEVFSRTFRAYEFVEVESVELDEAIREEFDRYTPPFLQLDYRLIGDYRLKPEPFDVHDRLFLSRDGETLAGISVLLETGSVGLISVLENGTCVDSCNSDNPNPQRVCKPGDQLWVSYLPGASIEDLHRRHREAVAERCACEGTRVLRLRSEQFRELVTYDQRVFSRWIYRNGGMDTEPPAPDFGSLRAPAPIAGHPQPA